MIETSALSMERMSSFSPSALSQFRLQRSGAVEGQKGRPTQISTCFGASIHHTWDLAANKRAGSYSSRRTRSSSSTALNHDLPICSFCACLPLFSWVSFENQSRSHFPTSYTAPERFTIQLDAYSKYCFHLRQNRYLCIFLCAFVDLRRYLIFPV